MPLEKVEICVTSYCNLQCKHCYQAKEKNLYELTVRQIDDILKFVARRNCKHIVLSGGEFFVHSKPYLLIDHVLEMTNSNIIIVSNLLRIDTDAISCFDKGRLSFRCSLDGGKKAHDQRRGNGTFIKALESLSTLNELGFETSVTTTLTAKNMGDIPELLDNPQIRHITFMPVANAGAASINGLCNENDLSSEEVLRYIYRNCTESYDANRRCNTYPEAFSVDYKGDVYPCSMARDFKLFKMGNIDQESIETIFDQFNDTVQGALLKEYECNGDIEQCNYCSQSHSCSRGCRMRAYKYHGALSAPDPFACKVFLGTHKNECFGDVYWGINRNAI